MYRLLTALLLLVVCASALRGQENVTFYVQPAESFLRVDGRVFELKKSNTIRLAPGTYNVELWAPKFDVREVPITVEAGKPTVVREGLRTVTAEYNSYRAELSTYNTNRLKRVLGEGSIAALSVGLAAVAATGRNNKLDELRDYTERQRTLYDDGVFDGAEQFLKNYNDGRAEFDDVRREHNTIVVGTSILAALGVAVLVKRFMSKNRKRYVRPTYNPVNPFQSGTTHFERPRVKLGGSTNPIGLTLQF
ncbi:hypothetical protein [Lewinella sp. 4G2]|uniref:hypothetical protein n=1 Tax=Lewinella sp. 4G2 TaxID=1803372 RepID=UPI0007B4EFEE|nr:hypothetical protein [Lewinella sp. 4G2]OAV44695.1 hypothetical protein A3850_009415 [Lewinella sp. 4G2]